MKSNYLDARLYLQISVSLTCISSSFPGDKVFVHTTLPPKVAGQTQLYLLLEIHSLDWFDVSLASKLAVVRVLFWGENSPGAIFRWAFSASSIVIVTMNKMKLFFFPSTFTVPIKDTMLPVCVKLEPAMRWRPAWNSSELISKVGTHRRSHLNALSDLSASFFCCRHGCVEHGCPGLHFPSLAGQSSPPQLMRSQRRSSVAQVSSVCCLDSTVASLPWFPVFLFNRQKCTVFDKNAAVGEVAISLALLTSRKPSVEAVTVKGKAKKKVSPCRGDCFANCQSSKRCPSMCGCYFFLTSRETRRTPLGSNVLWKQVHVQRRKISFFLCYN